MFDLDGTLLDTIEDLTDAMNLVLQKRGYPRRSVEEYKHLVGKGTDVFAQGALPPEARIPETVHELVMAYRVEYDGIRIRKTKPYPGIIDMLNGLAARNTSMAILSNKRDPVVQQEVARLLPMTAFTEIRGARSTVPLKPDPAAALLLSQSLERDPQSILFVGDTKTDMQTAVAAGMVAVGVLWGFRTANELRSNGAHHLINSPAEIPPLLGIPTRE